MRNSSITEGARYSKHLLPLKNDIYHNGSTSYSNLKNLVLSKEISIPKTQSAKQGLLPEIQAFFYVTQNNFTYDLHIFRYELNCSEILPNFSSQILFVKVFKPIAGIFNLKINFCLLIVTESDIIIYGIENDTHSIINTDFSCKLYATPVCVEVCDGKIFMGCVDGNVYCAIYKSIDLFNFKYLNLYSPDNSIIKNITAVFKRKKQKITAISVGTKYLIAIGKNIEVYNIEAGLFKVNEIVKDLAAYVSVQIVEETPLFFYCVNSNGTRDFFKDEKVFSIDPPIIESSDTEKLVLSTPSSFLSIRSTIDRSSFILNTFNEDQLRNFNRSKPTENYEVISIFHKVLDANLKENELIVLTPQSVLYYTILDSRKFLLNCRTQEIYLMYKNYGDVEFMIKYFQLLTENEEVSKLEGLCKNESIKTHALFVWIYDLIKPVWSIDLSKLKSVDELTSKEYCLDEIIKKLKILKQRLPFGYETAKDFIEEFIQTNFYITLLLDYKINVTNSFESILTEDTEFKNTTLNLLLDAFTLSQNIDPLLKTLQNNCPLYLPIEQINLQRGLQLIKKDDVCSMIKSLEYLSQTKLDLNVIKKFNEMTFYYGSVYLIKERFDFSYERAVSLFKESVKCKKSFNCGLEDTRESFLYPFFESILDLESYTKCICCDNQTHTVDLVSIDNPLFKVFLKDAQHRNMKACNLYWKYLLVRHMKTEAIQALMNLSQRADLSIDKKVDFLQTALSISTGTYLNAEIKLRLSLYDIQKELSARESSFKPYSLLDSDTLYNDYCCDHIDLKIKILSILKYKDTNVLKELFEIYFKSTSLRDCLLFLRELQNKNLEMVFDVLAKKIEKSGSDFCEGLLQAGFEYNEIVALVKERLSSNTHPDVKLQLLKNLRTFSKFGEFKDCEKICEKNFGIKIYK